MVYKCIYDASPKYFCNLPRHYIILQSRDCKCKLFAKSRLLLPVQAVNIETLVCSLQCSAMVINDTFGYGVSGSACLEFGQRVRGSKLIRKEKYKV